jgi:hypothetical protein
MWCKDTKIANPCTGMAQYLLLIICSLVALEYRRYLFAMLKDGLIALFLIAA